MEIPDSIKKFWLSQCNENEELTSYHINNFNYYSITSKNYFSPGNPVGIIRSGKLEIIFKNKYYSVEEFEKLLKLKAFW